MLQNMKDIPTTNILESPQKYCEILKPSILDNGFCWPFLGQLYLILLCPLVGNTLDRLHQAQTTSKLSFTMPTTGHTSQRTSDNFLKLCQHKGNFQELVP